MAEEMIIDNAYLALLLRQIDPASTTAPLTTNDRAEVAIGRMLDTVSAISNVVGGKLVSEITPADMTAVVALISEYNPITTIEEFIGELYLILDRIFGLPGLDRAVQVLGHLMRMPAKVVVEDEEDLV